MKRAWNYLSYQNLIYTHACLIGWILTNYACQMKTIYLFTLSLSSLNEENCKKFPT